MGKKKKSKEPTKTDSSTEAQQSSDSDDSDSGSPTKEKSKKMEVLPVAAKKPDMPGALLKPRRHPTWFSLRLLEEERPDLVAPDGKINLEKEEATLMDLFIKDKCDLQTGDLIVTNDNLDEDNRQFNRYEVQLKYNEGRYSAIYLISRQVCVNNEATEQSTVYAMKIGLRPNSANIVLRMKARCSFSEH
ncbi:hypothetical protein Q1695_006549 [Nippostrongylus brasiliensis]|nr:hypothetical protein Q1695_006549 [Nippostrongylus brasiliensis]